MKRLLIYSFTILSFLSFSQQIAVYDFENLSEGDINGQDGWQYSSSLSSLDNGYNCPVIGNPLVTEVSVLGNSGNYLAGKAIRTGSGYDNQIVLISRKNNADWSFPSLQNKQFLMFEFVMGLGCMNRSVKLGFDENMDGNYGENCGLEDINEASFGLSWSVCDTPTYLKLFDASSNVIATDNQVNWGFVRYLMVIDFYANDYQGEVCVLTKHLTGQTNWSPVVSMQNLNMGFDFLSAEKNNPINLDGIILQEGGDAAYFDDIKFTVFDLFPNDTTICLGKSLTLGKPINGVSYVWSTAETTPTIEITSEGSYSVDLYINNNKILSDSTYVRFRELDNVINDTSFCQNESITLFAEQNLDFYLWNDSSTYNQLQIDSPGEYSLYFEKNGCIGFDTIEVIEILAPNIDLGQDIIACPDEEVILQANTNGTAFKWSDGSTRPTLEVKQSGDYHLTTSIEQCTASDTINVTFIPSINLGNDTTICEGDFFTIDLDKDYEDYSWHDGDKSSSKDIHYDGEYFVTVKKLNCVIQSDTLKVNRVLLPRILETTDDTLMCENFPLLLKVKAELYDNLLWFDGHTDTVTLVRTSGVYWVSTSNECGVITDSIKVTTENCLCKEFLPDVFTPNGDRLNDFFGYESNCIPSKYYSLQIFNRWGEQIFESNDYKQKWDGTFKGSICPTDIYSFLLIVQYKNDMGKRTIKRKFSLIQ
ncbi:MAG: gliding motility-associated C-terminal domain-containing protein [Flavobacteriales bacterium]|nr:gliding motility-associated C-terminal domain-containing protein [Flavobacteriales bacterium]